MESPPATKSTNIWSSPMQLNQPTNPWRSHASEPFDVERYNLYMTICSGPGLIDTSTRLCLAIVKKDLALVKSTIEHFRATGQDVTRLVNYPASMKGWMDTPLCLAVRHWHAYNCDCNRPQGEGLFYVRGLNGGISCKNLPNFLPCGVFVRHKSTNEIVELLLKEGADPYIKNGMLKDAFTLASRVPNGHIPDLGSDPATETLEVLEKYRYKSTNSNTTPNP